MTLGAITDPGTDTVSSWVVHWGDGHQHTYTTPGRDAHLRDGPTTTTITVDLMDEDGDVPRSRERVSVHVNNVAPTVTLAATNTYTWPESATAEQDLRLHG